MSKTFRSSTADNQTSTADVKAKVSPSKMNPNSEGLLKQFLFEADENDLIEAAKRIKEMKNHWKNFNKKSRKVNPKSIMEFRDRCALVLRDRATL